MIPTLSLSTWHLEEEEECEQEIAENTHRDKMFFLNIIFYFYFLYLYLSCVVGGSSTESCSGRAEPRLASC